MTLDFTTVIIAALAIWVIPVVLSVWCLKSGFGFSNVRDAVSRVLEEFGRRTEFVRRLWFDKNAREEYKLLLRLEDEYKKIKLSAETTALTLAKEMELETVLRKQLEVSESAANKKAPSEKRRTPDRQVINRTQNKTQKKEKNKRKKKNQRQTVARTSIVTETVIVPSKEQVQNLTDRLKVQRQKVEQLKTDLAAIEQKCVSAYWSMKAQVSQRRAEMALEQSNVKLPRAILERMELRVRIKEERAGIFIPNEGNSILFPDAERSQPILLLDDLIHANRNLSAEQKKLLQKLAAEVDEEQFERLQKNEIENRAMELAHLEVLRSLDSTLLQELENERQKLALERERLEAQRQERLKLEAEQYALELKQKEEMARLQKIERDLQRKAELERSVKEYVSAELERRALYKETYESTSNTIEAVIKKASTVIKKFDIISAAAVAADPSVERAYARLTEQLALARKMMDESHEQESQMELQIKEADDKFNIVDLEAALKNHRRKNLSTEQQLFRIEGIVRRLYMIKVLLTALPTSKAEEFLRYTKVVNELSSYLNENWKENTEIKPPVEFPDRITDLEHATLMAFIRIAKVDWKRLSDDATANFQKNVTAATEIIESEKQNQSIEFERWENLAAKAFEENKELIHFVAAQRRDQCKGILDVTQQSLDTLELSLSVTEKKRNQSSQAS